MLSSSLYSMLTLSKTTSVPVKEVPGLGHLDDTLLHLVHRDPLVLVHVEQEPHLTRVRIKVIMHNYFFSFCRVKNCPHKNIFNPSRITGPYT